MKKDEIKPLKDIDIKFHRFIFPLLNNYDVPLNGLYNPIDNLESPEYPLINIFNNFDISPNSCANVENLLNINKNYLVIYTDEIFEGLLIIKNKSEKEMTVKDIKIELKIGEKELRNIEFPIEANIPNNPITIPSNDSYCLKVKSRLNYQATNYRLEVYFHAKSPIYDQIYNKTKQKSIFKNSPIFTVINNSLEYIFKKNILFKVYSPFDVNEIFHNLKENKCLIEIRISNNIFTPLSILDVYLVPKKKPKERIDPIHNLEEIKCNKYRNMENDSKYILLQPKEQMVVLFEIENTLLYSDDNLFIFNISWLNTCDFYPKLYTYEFNNQFNNYNQHYQIAIVEKPNGNIIYNQDFKVVIKIKTKNEDKLYTIYISENKIKDDDRTNGREIKIIDFVEKKIQINSLIPSANFTLICKSDTLGCVYFPKLKLSLYEDNKTKCIDNDYDPLLSFNCILNI